MKIEPIFVLAVVVAALPLVIRAIAVLSDWLEDLVEHSRFKDTFHRLS